MRNRLSPETQAVLARAITSGAITSATSQAGQALASVALRDLAAAQQFASKARTPLERVEIVLSVISNGSLDTGRAGLRAIGHDDPDGVLIRQYGG